MLLVVMVEAVRSLKVLIFSRDAVLSPLMDDTDKDEIDAVVKVEVLTNSSGTGTHSPNAWIVLLGVERV